MKEQTDNEGVLVQYLLGQLPEEEQQQIEQRAFDDDEFYRQLLEVEDDLRCAYAQGALPPGQREFFEKRFLIFADERKKVALARDMISELRLAPVEDASRTASNPRERRAERRPLFRFFGSASGAQRFAMAAVTLVVAAGVFWLLFETARLRNETNSLRAERAVAEQQLEQRASEERARVEQQDKQLREERDRRAQLEEELAAQRDQAGEHPARPAIVALLLAPGVTRGEGETKRLVLPQGVEQVRLRLELKGSDSNRYRAVLRNSEGNQIWSREGLRAREDGARSVISFGVPARILDEDDYELKLMSFDKAGRPERTDSYYFTALKK